MTDYLNSTIDFKTKDFVLYYDQLPLWSAPFGLLLLQHIPLHRDAVVLDVGCGTGFPLVQLAARLGPAATIHGIDPWEAAVERAQSKIASQKLENVQVSLGNAAKLPFPDQTFDLVVSNLGINNFDNPVEVIKECRRVLKPGGTVAITTNLLGHMRQFYEVYCETLKNLAKQNLIEKLDKEEAHRTTISLAKKLFEVGGFKNTKAIESSFSMRYADGSAFLNDYFTRLAFLASWRSILQKEDELGVFTHLEKKLNEYAAVSGYLEFTVPMAYLEFQRS